ncbi:MAG: hypothetical protein IJA78_04810 [Clostridia bacterium]|nr:hypothetical protein [Clostridia bacterium]
MNNDFNNAWSYGPDAQGGMYPPPIDTAALNLASALRKASTARTLGIIGIITSLLCCCLPPIGLTLGILAIVFACSANKRAGTKLAPAKTALVCGIIATVISAAWLIYMTVDFIIIWNNPAFWEEFYKTYEEAMQQYPVQ